MPRRRVSVLFALLALLAPLASCSGSSGHGPAIGDLAFTTVTSPPEGDSGYPINVHFGVFSEADKLDVYVVIGLKRLDGSDPADLDPALLEPDTILGASFIERIEASETVELDEQLYLPPTLEAGRYAVVLSLRNQDFVPENEGQQGEEQADLANDVVLSPTPLEVTQPDRADIVVDYAQLDQNAFGPVTPAEDPRLFTANLELMSLVKPVTVPFTVRFDLVTYAPTGVALYPLEIEEVQEDGSTTTVPEWTYAVAAKPDLQPLDEAPGPEASLADYAPEGRSFRLHAPPATREALAALSGNVDCEVRVVVDATDAVDEWREAETANNFLTLPVVYFGADPTASLDGGTGSDAEPDDAGTPDAEPDDAGTTPDAEPDDAGPNGAAPGAGEAVSPRGFGCFTDTTAPGYEPGANTDNRFVRVEKSDSFGNDNFGASYLANGTISFSTPKGTAIANGNSVFLRDVEGRYVGDVYGDIWASADPASLELVLDTSKTPAQVQLRRRGTLLSIRTRLTHTELDNHNSYRCLQLFSMSQTGVPAVFDLEDLNGGTLVSGDEIRLKSRSTLPELAGYLTKTGNEYCIYPSASASGSFQIERSGVSSCTDSGCTPAAGVKANDVRAVVHGGVTFSVFNNGFTSFADAEGNVDTLEPCRNYYVHQVEVLGEVKDYYSKHFPSSSGVTTLWDQARKYSRSTSRSKRFTVGPVPFKVVGTVTGELGMEGYAKVKPVSSSDPRPVLEFGAGPFANLTANLEGGPDIEVASAGIGGTLRILSIAGYLEHALNILAKDATIGLSVPVKSLDGNLYLYVRTIIGLNYSKTIINWSGFSQTWTKGLAHYTLP
jgi:hypothetical protein